MSVPNGPDGKPVWGNNRQQLTGYYLMSGGVAVVSLDAIDADNRTVILAPSQSFKNGDEQALAVPSFMYVSSAMAQAMLGAPPSSLKRGAPGKTTSRRDQVGRDAGAGAQRRRDPSGQRSEAQGRVRRDRRAQRSHRLQPRAGRSRFTRAFNTRRASAGRRRRRPARDAGGAGEDPRQPGQPPKGASSRASIRSTTAPTTTVPARCRVLEIAEALRERRDQAEALDALRLAHRRGEGAVGLGVLHRSSDGAARLHRRAAQHGHGWPRRTAR